MPVHLAVMVFQPSRDTYHGTYSSEAPSRLPQFFSSKHLAFLDLPTEFHDQILQASSDAAKRGKYYDARTRIGDNKTGLPGRQRVARLPKMLPCEPMFCLTVL
jgi:hypothetical protein